MLDILTGGTSFREIRETSCCYVDKTAFLEEFFRTRPAKVSLITRPRRFGKTLMMNMLSEFFDINKDSKTLFDGLAIAKNKELCDKWMNQHPVVFITLKEIDAADFNVAVDKIVTLVRQTAVKYAYLLKSDKVDESDKRIMQEFKDSTSSVAELQNFLVTFCRALHAHWGKPAIMLIDEYDVPLAKAQKKGYYPEMVDFIRGLLGTALKDNDYLQFAVLTGCLRISKESIFTGLNNFTCYGIADADFADKFGFTSVEVDALLAAAGFSEKKDEIKEWYDGYRFGLDTEIYCPWDILRHLRTLQTNPKADPQPYWENTSGNDIVRSFIGRDGMDVKEDLEALMSGGCLKTRLTETITYDSLYDREENIWTVLYLTGYLTKAGPSQMEKGGIDKVSSGTAVLAIPNKEVLGIFADAIYLWFTKAMERANRTELFAAFWADDAGSLTKLLRSQLEDTISFFDARENYYHGFLTGVFSFTGWKVKSNHEHGDGRPDIVVRDKGNNRAAAIEVKRAKTKEELPGLLEEAVNQGKDADYTRPLRKEFKKVSLWGMAFYKKTCLLKVEDISGLPVPSDDPLSIS